MKTLYKRNAQGKPIFWTIGKATEGIAISNGLVGKTGHKQLITTTRDKEKEIESLIKAKRKEGYKALEDLYDNAPFEWNGIGSLWGYLETYLPKFNTHEDGKFIPMLCKTLEDNKPFEKGTYFGEWKINGERCLISATKTDDLFQTVKLNYRSREGVDWTDKLSYLDEYLIPCIKGNILDMMLEENTELDGELYLPGYSINEINSFIKNTDTPQHYELQYWCYDLAVENIIAGARYEILMKNLNRYIPLILNKHEHLCSKDRFVLLPATSVDSISTAIDKRDYYIDLGFEGLVIRNYDAEYQFGGKRNNSMLKFKKIQDGLFEVLDVKEDKRGLPIFVLKNDLNDEVFECTINLPQSQQKLYLSMKALVKGKKGVVEFRERSGVKQVPFHAKLIKIYT